MALRARASARTHREPRLPGTVMCLSMVRLGFTRNLHVRGVVRRATSTKRARMRVARRSRSSIAELSRARSGSGKVACVCCMASASAIMRSSLRWRGFSRSQRRRFALRLCPSHSSAVPAGRPDCGSGVGKDRGLKRIIFHRMQSPNARTMWRHKLLSASSRSPLICPSGSTRPVTRMVRVSKTIPPYFSYASGKRTTS